ncbi:MAG: dUTP diphosphatase [Clostridiales bacterium]|nr:dUTP diphosphatase [Clostridiales bacterium]
MDTGLVAIKIKSESGKIPAYETAGAAGMDLSAYIEEDVVMFPGKIAIIKTGIFIELSTGYEAQIRARSGFAAKHGIGLVNGIGTIDSDYRGEIKVILINWGEESVTIKNGDRIAQMVICRYEKAKFIVSDTLSETERNQGGFGHTGV